MKDQAQLDSVIATTSGNAPVSAQGVRVVVGLSGGVDSSVAAYLLKEQGYDVVGVFMKNWHDDSVTISKECPWLDDSNDAMIVAQHLGIPFQAIDLSGPYKQRIVDYMFAEYQAGRTPNPDVLCNREIKFDIFLSTALKLGAQYVATGHYARKATTVVDGKTVYRLLAGKDNNKDQSYFLCQLTQDQLARSLFPLGELSKPEVRALASRAGLITAGKKDSQGLCFVGKVHLPEFLQQRLKPLKGDVIEVPAESDVFDRAEDNGDLDGISRPYPLRPSAGKIVGEHNGAHYYTIGQRRGLNIGGYPEPLFIIGTDTTQNIVYAGMGEDHPGLFRKGLFVPADDVHWIREDLALKVGEAARFHARIRYRQPLEACTLTRSDKGLYVIFDRPQRGITPGQFVAWYDGEELLGSGVIQ